jgi:hypothetical protein
LTSGRQAHVAGHSFVPFTTKEISLSSASRGTSKSMVRSLTRSGLVGNVLRGASPQKDAVIASPSPRSSGFLLLANGTDLPYDDSLGFI